MRRHRTAAATLGLLALLATSACSGGEDTTAADQVDLAEGERSAGVRATLLDPDGEEVGGVTMLENGDLVEIAVDVSDMTEGYHGFHVHTTGLCEPDSAAPDDPSETGDFLSAGGHLATGDQSHADHVGDLPSILVGADGTGSMVVTTDRFTLEDVQDDDGSAVMVHAGPDNFGNIPERYAPDGPDEDTLATGDSGDRVACGVVEE